MPVVNVKRRDFFKRSKSQHLLKAQWLLVMVKVHYHTVQNDHVLLFLSGFLELNPFVPPTWNNCPIAQKRL